ncbi:MAG: ATPase, partial [Actinobacteria bacterium]
DADGAAVAASIGFVVFSLFNISLGFSAHSETQSAFNRDVISDRRQLGLVSLAFVLTILPTQLDFLQRFLGLTELTGGQWLLCIGLAFALLLVDEVIKLVLRSREEAAQGLAMGSVPAVS